MKRLLLSLALLLIVVLGGGYFWLQQHTTSNVEAALAQFKAELPDGASFTYATVHAEPIDNSATVRDMRLALPDGRSFSAARLVIGDVLTDDQGRAETVGRLSAEAVSIKIQGDGPGELRIARFDAEMLRPGSLPQAMTVHPETWPSLERVTFEELRFDRDDSEEFSTATSGEATGVSGGRIDRILLRDFTVLEVDNDEGAGANDAGPDKKFSEAREVEIVNSDIGFFVRMGDPQTRAGAETSGRVGVIARDLAVSRNGAPRGSMEMAEVNFELSGDMSFAVTFTAEGLHIPVAKQQLAERNGLQELGYEDLRGTADAGLEMDAATGDVRFGFNLALIDAGAFDLDVELAKVPPLRYGETTKFDSEAVKQILLQRLEASYRDGSLAGRVIDKLAEAEGIDREDYVARYTAHLESLAEKLQSPQSRDSLAAFATFIETPGTLHIEAKPQAGTEMPAANALAIAMLSPLTLLQLLDVTVTRE